MTPTCFWCFSIITTWPRLWSLSFLLGSIISRAFRERSAITASLTLALAYRQQSPLMFSMILVSLKNLFNDFSRIFSMIQMFKLDLEKAEEAEIKLPNPLESSRKTSTSALLTRPKPLTVWITTNNGKILKEMGIPDHLTCLLRHLYAGQEATVRTGHGKVNWFQIGRRVCQGYILSPWLFNLHARYVMWNATLDKA